MTLLADLPTTDPVADARACIERIDPAALDPSGLAGLLRELGRLESQVVAVKFQVLAMAERSRVASRAGLANTSQWLASTINADPGAAAGQVKLAQGLQDRTATQRALAAGDLTPEHASVIVRATNQLPSGVTDEQRTVVEEALVAKAKHLSPSILRRAARRALAEIEPDPQVVDEHENALVVDEETLARAKTRLSLHDNDDGTVTGHFTVPTLHGHLLRKVLETMTAPRRGRLGASQAQIGDAAAQTHGLRTDWDHARGTAFCELLEHLPTDRLHSRTAATIVVTMTAESLRGALQAAGLDTGGSVSFGETRRLLCNAGVIPAVLSGRSVPLDLGRTARLFNETQRIALGLRHQTCAADGCHRPFAWCELHHRDPWSQGGKTDLDDAVPLCHFHHQRIHDPHYGHVFRPAGLTFHMRT